MRAARSTHAEVGFKTQLSPTQRLDVAVLRALAEEVGAYPEVVEAAYRALVAGFIAREQQDFAGMADIEPKASE